MARFRTLDDLDPNGKRVLLRADLNVPVANGKVTDATRIERLAPTISELAKRGARVVVMSHFGRPKNHEPELSLRPIAPVLAAALGGRHVAFADDCVGPSAQQVVRGLRNGEVALLENLRFHKGEEKNDPAFATALADLGDMYV
ncbi:MAG TPA: phosphoglycerate kinase, partial [Stellaceae bacterium]|nr:phosphoglycerate kinase [Stellaceae bacterium]